MTPPSPVNHLSVFSNIQPSELWQLGATLVSAKGGTLDLCSATFSNLRQNQKILKIGKTPGPGEELNFERFSLPEISFACHKKSKNFNLNSRNKAMTFFHLKLICAYCAQLSLSENRSKNLSIYLSWVLCSLNKASYEEKRSKFSKDQEKVFTLHK